jgi:lysophospholipase L1-like esterase
MSRPAQREVMLTPEAPRTPLRPRTLGVLTVLIGVGLAALVLELVVRALYPRPLPWFMPQNVFVPSATLGFRYAPNQSAFTADKPFRTNAAGLRGPERPWKKPAGLRRVLVLGDSVAMGYGVREEDAFPAVLERELNREGSGRIEVINAGVAAYSTGQEVTYFLDEGIRYQPDAVVVGLYWNDVSDKSDVQVKPTGVLIDAEGRRRASWVRRLLQSPTLYEIRNALKRSRALYLIGFQLRQLRARFEPDPTREKQMAVLLGTDAPDVVAGFGEIERQLARLAAACRAAGIRLLVAVLPMPQQLELSFPHAGYQSVVADICARQGLDCLDLLPAFRAEFHGHESLFIGYDGDHPNERGHAVIARALREPVASRLVPPPAQGTGSTESSVGGAGAPVDPPPTSSAPMSQAPPWGRAAAS